MQGIPGLDGARSAAFATLVAGIAGQDMPAGERPYLAPALLFADPAAQAAIGMPVPAAGEVLVHEYQAVQAPWALPDGAPLEAGLERQDKGALTELRFALRSGGAETVLDTALRRVAREEVRNARPTAFRGLDALGDLGASRAFSVSQKAVDAYLALSGDANPIHRDPAEAAALGLAAPVVPGLLLVSCIQPVCAAALPGAVPHSLKARFMGPLVVGEAVRVVLQARGTAADGGRRCRAYIAGPEARALAVADLVFAA